MELGYQPGSHPVGDLLKEAMRSLSNEVQLRGEKKACLRSGEVCFHREREGGDNPVKEIEEEWAEREDEN